MKDELYVKAKQILSKAYAPYSQFKVGAALLTDKGSIYCGCNVENASYGLSLCAESVAIGNMISDGGSVISEIAVVGTTEFALSPCGSCRQRILEFSTASTLVHMCSIHGVEKTETIGSLLPLSFGSKDLERN